MKIRDSRPAIMAGILALAALGVWSCAVTTGARAQEITAAANEKYEQAKQLIDSQSWSAALARLDKVVALSPQFAGGFATRGYVKEQLGDFSGAAADYTQAHQLDPESTDHMFNAAKAYYQGGQAEQALATLEPLAADTLTARVPLLRARVQARLKMFDEAAASARQATELDPQNAEAFYTLGSIEYDRQRASKQYDQGIAAYQQALELAPEHQNAHAAHFKLGRMLYRMKRYAAAETHYRAATELRPDYAPGFVSLGDALHREKQEDGAIAAYQKAIELKAPAPYGLASYNLGRVYWTLEDAEAAIEAYQAAAQDPGFKYADKAREAIASIEDYLNKKKKAGGDY